MFHRLIKAIIKIFFPFFTKTGKDPLPFHYIQQNIFCSMAESNSGKIHPKFTWVIKTPKA